MTIILGCGAATIRGWLLCEPRLLTGQIRYFHTYSVYMYVYIVGCHYPPLLFCTIHEKIIYSCCSIILSRMHLADLFLHLFICCLWLLSFRIICETHHAY